jgi:Zn-dependent protease
MTAIIDIMNIDIVYIIIVLVVILVSMTLHEAMHAYVGYWLGDDTAKSQGRLSINPIRHIDPFLTIILPISLAIAGLPIFGGAKPVPFNPQNVKGGEWGAALVAIAGPLTNFAIAFITYALWSLLGHANSGIVNEIVVALVTVNLGFFAFNLIPIPPLDGSRVLYALAPEFVRRGMEYVERYGIILVFIIVLLAGSLIGPLMAGIINFFISLFAQIFQ